ncbi:restriction endonuclease subunit S [Aliarcobacter thereius]|uniref:restriction endonuclease subunit S n=1 Tax=Aliarcobacter thereius TaxID=544718 RepID=UPI000825B738|nr:restriction endonuclease subunit S [Aliarcobacter thereius]OCL94013.1 EcoKI restriction-modification system protein HsdS [Aliarcobacter thereius]
MSELYTLPNGWEWVEFSKIFDTPTSKPYQIQKTEYLENGLLPIIDQGKEFIIGYTNLIEKKYSNESNCIIFGDHTRQIKYVDFDFVIGADGTKILKEKDKNKYDLKFLYFQFLSKKIESLGYSRHFKLVKEMFFAIPPLEEQKRIVVNLDILFAKIDKAITLHQKNIDEADIFMASVLNDIFVELEEKYEKKQLNEIIKIIGGGTPSKANKEYWENGTIKWATVGDMNVETITKTELSITEIGLKNSSSNIIPKNGIIIATRVGLGKVCYLDDDIAINQDLKGLIPKYNNLNIRYLFNFFKNIEKYIISNGTGATVKGVKVEFIKELEIPLPSLETQQKVVAYLDEISNKIEKIKQIQKEKMQSLKELKASILDKAFKGEL